jgi:cytochrome b
MASQIEATPQQEKTGNRDPVKDASVPSGRISVPVWDLPTRVFHWLLVISVLVAWITAEQSGVGFVLHKLAGYAIGAALIFRVIWGFVGSPHSRFDDFVRPWSEVAAHLRMLLRLHPPHSIGHNAIGGWMIVALLADLTVIVATGLFAASRRFAGPLADMITLTVARSVGGLHEFAFNVLLVLVTIHILGVVTDMALNRENLVGSMWSGRKWIDTRDARGERPFNPVWWAVAAAVIAIIVMAGIAL